MAEKLGWLVTRSLCACSFFFITRISVLLRFVYVFFERDQMAFDSGIILLLYRSMECLAYFCLLDMNISHFHNLGTHWRTLNASFVAIDAFMKEDLPNALRTSHNRFL